MASRPGGAALDAALVLLLTAPFYACALYTDWYIDELFAIVRNADVRADAPLWHLLVHDFWGQELWPQGSAWTHKSFRPLVTLSFRWQLMLQGDGGMRPGPLRAASCAVHSLNSLLVRQLLCSMGLGRPGALLGAALFALHPAHVENLPYLVGRADSMATFFLVSGVLLWRGARRAGRWARVARGVACALCAPLAGLCKETGFMLPAVLAWEGAALGGRAAPCALQLLWLLCLGAARSWYVGGTDVGFSFVDTPVRYSDSLLTRTLSYLQHHARYAQLLVFPWELSWDYSYDALPLVRGAQDVRLLSVLAAYGAAVAGLAWAARRRDGPALLALGLTAVPFLPCSNLLFLVGTTVAERLLYPCTVGWAALAARLEPRGRARRGPRRAPWLAPRRAVALALLAAYGYRSGVRMWQWRSKAALFSADARVWHRSAKVSHQYASVLHGQGRLEEALALYNRSIEIFDDSALTDYCMAKIYLQLNQDNQARACFEKILAGHGIGFGEHNLHLLYIDYGFLLVRTGRYAEAHHFLREGLRRKPGVAYAWNALGVAQARVGDFQAAMDSFVSAIELQPKTALLWSNSGALAAQAGALVQAADALHNARALDPHDEVVAANARVLLDGAGGELTLGLFLGVA